MTDELIDVQVKVIMDQQLQASLADMTAALQLLGWPDEALEPFMEHVLHMLTYAWWASAWEFKLAAREAAIARLPQ
jgi:hypothetical protein